jgi:SAM-dependent methyltransferase
VYLVQFGGNITKFIPIKFFPMDGRYATIEYWDGFYASSEGKESSNDEWIFNFESMKPFLELVDANHIVDVGCGVSPLLDDIRKSGFVGRLSGIDFSSSAIDNCRKIYAEANIQYYEASADRLLDIVGSERVDVIIDKTAIDSMLCSGPEGRATALRYLEQVGQCLREDGVFVWATFEGLSAFGFDILNGTIIPGLTASNNFHGLGWSAEIHMWDGHSKNSKLEPSLYIFKKTHRSPKFLGDDVSSVETTLFRH